MSASLAAISVGSTVKVQQVAGDDAVAVRLMEMGIKPGVEISIVGCAPLGDPIEIEVRGYRLSLRRIEAECILCESA